MSRFYNKLAAACMLLSCSAISYADDAEIFFNKELQRVNPNVIFLLDTSGSMAFYTNSGSNAGNAPNRMDALKEAFEELFTNNQDLITNIRMGAISFQSSLKFLENLHEVDDVNSENDGKITVTTSGTSTVLTQTIINNTDGYVSKSNSTARLNMTPANFTGSNEYVIQASTASNYLAFRFNNILLKQAANADTLIQKATLKLARISGNASNVNNIKIYMDPVIPSPVLQTKGGFVHTRVAASKTDSAAKCQLVTNNLYIECDITNLLREKVKSSEWKDGDAVSLYLDTSSVNVYLSSIVNQNNGVAYEPKLIVQLADNSLITQNKKTYREQFIEKVWSLKANGGTNTVYALHSISTFISDVNKGSNTKGPYHDTTTFFGKNYDSPIEEGCQLTHTILMTDGQPQSNYNGSIGNYTYNTNAAKYMGYNSYGNCKIVTGLGENNEPITADEHYNDLSGNNAPNSERCGRALASWMAKIDQSSTKIDGANFIRTHTIGFALDADPKALNFLQEVAGNGEGIFRSAKDKQSLVQAFKDIVLDVRATDSPSASGTVTLSAQSSYQQRNEVFYALYASRAQNYWSGNMKGFLLKYVDVKLKDGTMAQRPTLVDKTGAIAMGEDGNFIKNISSFWSENDSGAVEKGGVRGLLTVTKRPQFTYKSKDSKIFLTDEGNITASDLGLTGSDAEDRKKGLLNFIKGYIYTPGVGSTAPAEGSVLKLADSARSGVTLVTYGCGAGSSVKLKDCGTLELSQVALLASNDGFIRGYDTSSGTVLYEYMPKEMLPLISKLYAETVVNYNKPRFYGLDGNIVIYHDDANGNDYIDNNEKAYAYAVAGRGGPYIYALDISNSKPAHPVGSDVSATAPKLAWQITGSDNGFDRLGDAWSVPTVGKIKHNGVITPVLVFGGGYDKTPTEEDTYPTRTSSKGNAVYIVNALDGTLIQSITEGLTYSIPSSIALVTDDSGLMTNIVFGDTGGQVWRFIVNNAGTDFTLSGGLVAKLGSGGSNSRKFFQKPSIYQYKEGNQEMISINIGSGFRNHPLSTDIHDKIYSLRFPKDSNGSKILTETDLATSTINYSDTESERTDELKGSLSNGFVINLNTKGEKVITDGLAEFGRLVFNTYEPVATDRKTCKPRVGLQRTYVFDLMTGKSLLETAYLETNVSALPADVTYYCTGSYCTIVPSVDILSEKELPKGKGDTDSPLLNNVSPKANPSNYIKTGSTDLFDLSPK